MKNLKILNLEDNIYDSELIYEELKSFIKDEFKFIRVETKNDFNKQIFLFKPDLILSDYRLPQYNGLEALEDLIITGLDIPFIIVTGSLAEETAADSIKAGAWDYVVKERLFRLETAVKSALRLKEEKDKQKRSQMKLQTLSKAVEQAPVSVIITDKTGKIKYVNPRFESLTGYSFAEVQDKTSEMIRSNEDNEAFDSEIGKSILQGKEWRGILKNRKKNNEYFWSSASVSPIKNEQGEIVQYVGIEQDITEQIKASDALKESEQRYQILSNATFESIFIIENNLCINLNKTAEKMFGYSLEEAKGKPILNWISKGSHQLVELTLSSGYGRPFESKAVRKDGSEFPCEIQSRVINYEGESLQLMAMRDITQRKIAETALIRSEQKYRELIENQGEGIVLTNTDALITFANKAAEKIFGVGKDGLLNRSVREFIVDPEGKFVDKEQRKRYVEGEKSTYEAKVKNDEGEIRYLLITGTPRYNEAKKIIGSFGIFRDITDRKKILLELEHAKEKAEESDRLKTVFLQNMSHEIRTPMNGIMGFAELLNEKDLAESKRKEYTNIISNSSRQLLSILQDIITISSLETRQEKISEELVSVNDLMHELQTLSQESLADQGIQFIIEESLPKEKIELITDPVKLRQIFDNLINNAIKFTKKGSITIGYSLTKKGIKFFVKDTGIGIRKEDQSRIFNRFWQVERGTTRKYGGTGLGLSICKGLVELLNGKIWVESDVGKGSAFYFEIPADNKVGKKSKLRDDAEQYPDLSGKNILIAEDEMMNYEYLAELLKYVGAKTIHAKNGKEAIQLCDKSEPDLILMDIKMPVMDGYEATREIRKKFPELPIIAQTAYVNTEDKEKTERAGFHDFIPKPIRSRDLFRIINQHLIEPEKKPQIS